MYKKDTPSVGLCFVMQVEKKKIYDRRKVFPTRYRTVIYIEYTRELHEGLKERRPMEIIDLRNRGGYRRYDWIYPVDAWPIPDLCREGKKGAACRHYFAGQRLLCYFSTFSRNETIT